jgi:glycerophosphoryl diester phosphodiesterase
VSGVTGSRRLSRRNVLVGVAGTAVLVGAGVPVAMRLTSRPRGKLVPALLDGSRFDIAHRGGSRNWPEMSLYAYRNAVETGVDALEISLARSKDGVWFGLHDETLDRTSGVRGMVAAEHTWAEISALRIRPPDGGPGGQTPQPYLRFEQLAAAYAGTHTIFVDPKLVAKTYHPELLGLMAAAVERPQDSFVAKYYCTGRSWPDLARRHGYRTWGYYYGQQIADGTTPLADTHQRWDLLGLDYDASAEAWRAVLALGKPVIAHVIPDRAGADRAVAAGARGLMVSGVLEVVADQ